MSNQYRAYEEQKRITEFALAGLTVGGQSAMPFHWFDGEFTNKLAVGFEVLDVAPTDWPEPLTKCWEDVWNDPMQWARAAVREKADFIYLRLVSCDPNLGQGSAERAAETACQVADAVDIPVFVVGPGDAAVDAQVSRAVAARASSARRLVLGLAEESNYHEVALAALSGGHAVIASSPIDVNLAKQLNVLLMRTGLKNEDLLMDPTSGALGYGLEYSYSVFERIRLAALSQGDQTVALPIIAIVGPEAWKVKESRASEEELSGLGDVNVRGVLWETITAVALAVAGADLVVVRHPQSAALLRETAEVLTRAR